MVLKWAGVVRRGGGDDLTPWLAIREREAAAVVVVGAAVDARLRCHAMANQRIAGAGWYDGGGEAWKAPCRRSVPSIRVETIGDGRPQNCPVRCGDDGQSVVVES